MAFCVSPSQTKNLNNSFFLFQLWNITKGNQEKEYSNDIKDELLDSLVSIDKLDETGLNDVVRNAKDPKEAVAVIKKCKELLNGLNKKINIVAKQRKLMKILLKNKSNCFYDGIEQYIFKKKAF